MGDRVNFEFKSQDTGVVTLYSHWGGSTAKNDLANALDKALPRWRDPSYATRIAISCIIGDKWDSEIGYGLFGLSLEGEENPTLKVNWTTAEVNGVPFPIFCALHATKKVKA